MADMTFIIYALSKIHIWLSRSKQIEALLWLQACNMLLLYCQTSKVFHMEARSLSWGQNFITVFIFVGFVLSLSQFVFIHETVLQSIKSVYVVTVNVALDSSEI